ncbi:MAG: hypothetical protein V3T70_00010 [Phycisphaerae bacterium]
MHLRRNQRHPFIRSSPNPVGTARLSTWLAFATVVAIAPAAGADTVADDIGVFADVRIVGMANGKLAFILNDTRTLERDVMRIRSVQAASALAGGDPLSRAETLFEKGRYDQAVLLYERAQSTSSTDWIRDFAAFRLTLAYDRLDRFDDAVSSYLSLIDRHPALVSSCVPDRPPAPGSAEADRVTARLNKAIESPRSEAAVRAISRVRRVLERGPRRNDPSAKDGRNTAGRHAGKRKALPREQRATAEACALLSKGELAAARTLVATQLKRLSGASRDIWWLAEAECCLAAGDPVKAGLSAMKVVAWTPDSPFFAEALFLAGRAFDSIRPTKARRLYAVAAAHATAGDELQQKAAERLAALPKPAEAPAPPATRPAG